VGTIAVGTIVYLQDGLRPLGGPVTPAFRNPWIVQAWLLMDREGHGIRQCHLAVVKGLRDGRVTVVADWIILRSLELQGDA
jgi:hypothetical protein